MKKITSIVLVLLLVSFLFSVSLVSKAQGVITYHVNNPAVQTDVFEKNSDWLRFSFHALHNDPSFPYERSKPEELKDDYMLVLNELRRIVGCAATNETTTIHYVAATKEACSLLGIECPEEM